MYTNSIELVPRFGLLPSPRTGTRPDYLVNHADKKVARKSRNSWNVNGRGCGCTRKVDSGRGVGGRLKRTKKPLARAGWPRRLALVRATPHAEVDVIGVQQCSIAWAIFPS